jgi:hypothetical protein
MARFNRKGRRERGGRRRAKAGAQIELSADSDFRARCAKHQITPTRRQESKYRNGFGALRAAEAAAR